MKIYLDSAPIIYLVEQIPAYAPAVAAKLSTFGGRWVTSELARMESLVIPRRRADVPLIQDFENFFSMQLSELYDIDRTVFDRAIDICATLGFKSMDALHLAVAVVNGCDLFLTNDHQLLRFADIVVEVI